MEGKLDPTFQIKLSEKVYSDRDKAVHTAEYYRH